MRLLGSPGPRHVGLADTASDDWAMGVHGEIPGTSSAGLTPPGPAETTGLVSGDAAVSRCLRVFSDLDCFGWHRGDTNHKTALDDARAVPVDS